MDAPTKRPTHKYFLMLQKKIIIRIADTISVVEEIKVEELWGVTLGTGKHLRAPTRLLQVLVQTRALPAFHAVTDCDTVSFFGWNGKIKGLKDMNCIPYSGVGFFRSWY